MWYIKINMNKDTIYIEPENDITDILAKLKDSEQKIVALVPPKKAGVLRSAVNIKLIAKTARDNEKVVVLVTTDPSLIKLAASTRIPVAKDLQSRPEIPTEEDVEASMKKEQVIEDDLSKPDTTKDQKTDNKSQSAKKPEKSDDSDEDDKPKKVDKEKKSKKDGKKVPDIKKTRKLIIIGASAFVCVVAFLIWALAIAPKANVNITMKTTANGFSENVTFTTEDSEENLEEGKFLLEEQKLEKKDTINFTATGQKDNGNKASGSLSVYGSFTDAGSISIPAGATFSYGGMTFAVANATSLSWNGEDSNCDEGSSIRAGCKKSTTVNVVATQPGTQFNVGSQSSGWISNVGGIYVASSNGIGGGTSDIKTIVTQADIDKAKASIEASADEDAKSELVKSFKDNMTPIDSSFKQVVGEATSSPAVGEECSGNATLSITTTLTMYAVDGTRVEEFIKSKADASDDQEVYSVGEPYFDRFVSGDTGFAAKLKTTTQIGPKLSYDEILSKTKGKKIGEAQAALKSVTGVKEVSINGNFFWVRSVPNDDNRVNIEINVETDNNNNNSGEKSE